mmetsp:Transcript_84885/g.169889  ORF Transcript_84885/g.169889 Transcript_84885/m.169889 type:complete len:367 (+) Transcript_84885:50-1150(+)
MSSSDANGNKKPADTAFKQQRLSAVRPIFTPLAVGVTFLVVGIPFILIGQMVKVASGQIKELSMQYDGDGAAVKGCEIHASGAATTCTLSFTADDDMSAPVYVYYQLSNFYQNHRRYVKSYDKTQLLGGTEVTPLTTKNCAPLDKVGDLDLSPCGLIANSLFNDKILLSSKQQIDYDGTAWSTDAQKYAQPEGFKAAKGSDCKALGEGKEDCKAFECPLSSDEAAYYGCDAGQTYMYWYPNDADTQYLYESFPEVVSPMLGVNTDRFQVWMRAAALPKFRKLYATITSDIKSGEAIEFEVEANFDVSAFKGTKSLVLSTTTWFGGKNDFLGTCFLAVGSVCLAFGVGFLIKQCSKSRVLGDLKYLQ